MYFYKKLINDDLFFINSAQLLEVIQILAYRIFLMFFKYIEKDK
jgi:hypothetical protein